MLLSTLIDGFLLDCQARNISQRTIALYKTALQELSDFLKNPQVDTLSITDLRRFVVYNQDRNKFSTGKHPFTVEQQGKHLSPWTIHRYVRIIKTLFNWATNEAILQSNPASNLKKPQLPKDQIKSFSDSEIETVLSTSKATSFRDYVLCVFLLDSGVRKAELIHLTLNDINLLTGVVTILHGKGDKSRQVCVGKVCRKALWLYVNEHRKPQNEGETALFLTYDGLALTYNGLGIMLHRLSLKCGFRVFAHRFRHTFGTLLARKVQNAFLIAQALGHSDLETAKGYIHLSQNDTVKLFSPLDDLLK